MNCKEVRSLFSEFYLQPLPQEINKALEEHLTDCSECQKEFKNSIEILKLKKDLNILNSL